MTVKERIQSDILLFDGGTGALLQAAGLPLGELPERWNITNPAAVEKVHRDYFDAGSTIVCTNTFGANRLKFSETELAEVICAGVEIAKRARERSSSKGQKYIALDIGPCGKLLKPYGDFAFEAAVALFAEVVKIGAACGVDLVYIETLGDSLEMKAAVLAAKENCTLPIIASCAYGGDGKLTTGATPAATVALLEGLGVDAVGVNCSVGAKEVTPVVEELLENASVPVLVKPNVGLPDERGAYAVDAEEFAQTVAEFVKKGARLAGGCCGTTPAHIRALAKAIEGISPQPIADKEITVVSSYTHAVRFDRPLRIGERINPTGKKRFQQALKERDIGYILAEGVAQQEKGVEILDVNVGAPDIDEGTELPRYIEELQAIIDLPLQIDTSNPLAMERAMRLYNGKPLVNSVNGKKESMTAVFPLVKKYGGVVVALTLDEEGIPDTVEGRLAIAEKMIAEGAKYGVAKKDIVVDPLAMAIGASQNAARVTLDTVRALSKRGIKTSLGISNVSFGLPARELVNAAFYAEALALGLSAAILNPHSTEMAKVYYAHLALSGLDAHCENYISYATEILPKEEITAQKTQATGTVSVEGGSLLRRAIVKGLKGEASNLTKALLREKEPLEIIDGEIVPALDTVGKAYEEKKAFLPQLLICAEAAKAAFEEMKAYMANRGQTATSKGKIILATVRGDIHDIGKNIVASLLENYGFTVIDLGKDIPPETVVQAVEKENAPFVGLSALMTTTLLSMEKTVALLRQKTPWVKILVGGAVVTQEYADKIGAHFYGKDAMASVRFVENNLGE